MLNVPGVTDAVGYENDTGSTDGNGIPAHKICVVVEGGSVGDVAQAIQVHKTPGTGTFGNTSQIVYDAHGMPLTIKFQRPTPATINVGITIAANAGYATAYGDLIKQALSDTILAFGIGSTILITKLYAPAYLLGTPAGATFDITILQISKNADPLGSVNVILDFDEIPVCDPSTDITLTVT